MKRAISTLAILALPVLATSETSVSDAAPYSWSPNAGWIDWRGDDAAGAVLNIPPVASGYIYSANIGWIHLGDGSPANGTSYGNDSATDCGVNFDLQSEPGYILLSGYAYSANAGWISFSAADTANQPKIDLKTGQLSGYAYGANIGWLPLDSSPYGVVTALPNFGLSGFLIF